MPLSLFTIKCTHCGSTIAYSHSEMQQPEFSLCYTCMESYSRMADFLREDGKDLARVELHKVTTLNPAHQMYGTFVRGLQKLTAWKLQK